MQIQTTVLTPAERGVYLRMQRDAWAQLQALFPRLKGFTGPALHRTGKPAIRVNRRRAYEPEETTAAA